MPSVTVRTYIIGKVDDYDRVAVNGKGEEVR